MNAREDKFIDYPKHSRKKSTDENPLVSANHRLAVLMNGHQI